MLYVDNLAKLTTEDDLRALFAGAGDVTAIKIIKDRNSGESKGFGFITMSAQSEADNAVSKFNSYSLRDHRLKVHLAMPRPQRGTAKTIFEP
jgi:RNA recognition motif-containing protein